MYRRIVRLGRPIPEFQLQVLCAAHHAVKTGRERRLKTRGRPIERMALLDAKAFRSNTQQRRPRVNHVVEAAVIGACADAGGAVRLASVARRLGVPQPPETDADKRRTDLIRKALDVLARDPGSPVTRPRWGMYLAEVGDEEIAS